MDKVKKNLPVILLSVSCTLLLVAVILLINNNNVFKISNSSNKEDKEKNNTKEVEKIKESVDDYTKSSDEEVIVDVEDKPVNTTTNTSTNTETPKVYDTVFSNENDFLAYYQNEEASINSNSQTVGQRAKSVFVDVVDFIFYDKEIKGYTFKGLTNTAKLKIISIALKIDNKIDSYFPGYKDTIGEKYRNVKEKLAESYAKWTVNLCDKVGEDTCNQFKEDFANMKESFGITGDYLKEGWSKLKDKVKSSYEEWRDK